MASFIQWYGSRLSGRASADWVYAAGDPVLVAEVEAYVRRPSRFGTIPLMVESVAGKGLSWPDLSGHLRTSSLHQTQHLLIIREGEAVPASVWDDLLSWYRSVDPAVRRTRFILVTDSKRFRSQDVKDPRHLAFVKARWSQHVDCHLPPERQVKYVMLKLGDARASGGLEDIAKRLVSRCGGDLSRLKSECEKLMIYCGSNHITMDATELVVQATSGEMFVDDLVHGRRKEAAARAPYVGSLRFVLGSLEWHVHTLFLIHVAMTEMGRRPRLSRVAARIDVPVFVVERIAGAVSQFDQASTRRRLKALVTALRASDWTSRPEWVLLPLVAAW